MLLLPLSADRRRKEGQEGKMEWAGVDFVGEEW